MVEPVTITSIVAKAVVSTASDYISQRVKLGAEAQARHEQIAAEAEGRRETITHARWLARFEADADERLAEREAARRRSEQLEQRKLEYYPVEQGPGFLRDSLNLGREPAAEQKLVVLLAPPLSEDASGAAAAGLRVRVEDDLRGYVGSLLRPWLINRPLQWPNHDLYVCDLYDVPALILQIALANGLLTVRLGGCNLGLHRIEDPQSVHRMDWPSADAWTVADIERLNATGFASRSFAARVPVDDARLRELNHEFASRIVTLCVIAAMDAFYLARRVGYDEMLDAALRTAGAANDWAMDSGVDDSIVADPTYHRLHDVARHLDRGETGTAREVLRTTLRLAAGSPQGSEIAQVIREGVANGALVEHHRRKARTVIERFPAAAWRRAALAALDGPQQVKESVRPEPDGADTRPILIPRGGERIGGHNRMTTAEEISAERNADPLSRREPNDKGEPR